MPAGPYDWDEAKRKSNLREHRTDFAAASEFDWDTAVTAIDDRQDYGEVREVAIGFIGVTLYSLVFTRRSDRIRIISLRKAESREKRFYVNATKR
jgi:uncharacterized DUF497 family protein